MIRDKGRADTHRGKTDRVCDNYQGQNDCEIGHLLGSEWNRLLSIKLIQSKQERIG